MFAGILLLICKVLTWVLSFGPVAAIFVFMSGNAVAGILVAVCSALGAYCCNSLGASVARGMGIQTKKVQNVVISYKTGKASSHTTYEREGFRVSENEYRANHGLPMFGNLDPPNPLFLPQDWETAPAEGGDSLFLAAMRKRLGGADEKYMKLLEASLKRLEESHTSAGTDAPGHGGNPLFAVPGETFQRDPGAWEDWYLAHRHFLGE
jgi:hypothetical protein